MHPPITSRHPRDRPGLPSLREPLLTVASRGWTCLPGALSDDWIRRLLDEFEPAAAAPVPEDVGRVRQQAREMTVSVGDPEHPSVRALASSLRSAVLAQAEAVEGLGDWRPNEASYLHYRGADAGITPHRDRSRHRLLVAVFTLVGRAPFAIVGDRAGTTVLAEWTTAPGDLCLLGAPGLAGRADGRPLHRVGAPADERISLGLRMNRAAGPHTGVR